MNFEAMFRLKQDDWLAVCKEADQLRVQLEAAQKNTLRMEHAAQDAQAEVEEIQEARREWIKSEQAAWGCVALEQGKNARLQVALKAIRTLVDQQAEDEGLWSVPAFGTQPISEAYLQQELRRLHAAVEQHPGEVDDTAVTRTERLIEAAPAEWRKLSKRTNT